MITIKPWEWGLVLTKVSSPSQCSLWFPEIKEATIFKSWNGLLSNLLLALPCSFSESCTSQKSPRTRGFLSNKTQLSREGGGVNFHQRGGATSIRNIEMVNSLKKRWGPPRRRANSRKRNWWLPSTQKPGGAVWELLFNLNVMCVCWST